MKTKYFSKDNKNLDKKFNEVDSDADAYSDEDDLSLNLDELADLS